MSSNMGFGFFFRHGDDLIVTPFAQVSTLAAGQVSQSSENVNGRN